MSLEMSSDLAMVITPTIADMSCVVSVDAFYFSRKVVYFVGKSLSAQSVFIFY